MSETIAAPAADAPAATPSEGVRPPAALTDSPISASEAARILNRQRHQPDGAPATQQPAARSGPAAADQMAEALGLRAEHMQGQEQPQEPQQPEHVPGFEV